MPRTTPSPVAIHDRLRTLIDADGRSQVEIAKAAGMPKAQLHHLLSGIRPNPTYDTLKRLLGVLGKRFRDLD
jgi:transcriptional regulator with XRE-family HTH domain